MRFGSLDQAGADGAGFATPLAAGEQPVLALMQDPAILLRLPDATARPEPRQQPLALLVQPALSDPVLAVWTGPMAAGVRDRLAMGTRAAVGQPVWSGVSPTLLDRSQCLPGAGQESVTVVLFQCRLKLFDEGGQPHEVVRQCWPSVAIICSRQARVLAEVTVVSWV